MPAILEPSTDNRNILVHHLLKLWPIDRARVAQNCSLTIPELRKFEASELKLDQARLGNITRHMRLEYTTWEDAYRFAGPGVLFAHNEKSLAYIYNRSTFGWDAYPFEAVPEKGSADPQFRYYLFNPCAGGLIVAVVIRGTAIEPHMPHILRNFIGSIAVPDDFWRSLVAACEVACTDMNNPFRGIDCLYRQQAEMLRIFSLLKG